MKRLLGMDEHSGVYRLLTPEYKANLVRMCEEYELEMVNGNPVPKSGSKYENGFPVNMLFDYSVNSRA